MSNILYHYVAYACDRLVNHIPYNSHNSHLASRAARALVSLGDADTFVDTQSRLTQLRSKYPAVTIPSTPHIKGAPSASFVLGCLADLLPQISTNGHDHEAMMRQVRRLANTQKCRPVRAALRKREQIILK